MTTTQITSISFDLTDYAGDFLDDYDMDAVHGDYLDAIQAKLPEGVTVLSNGDVLADVEVVDEAREIDWDEIKDGIDPAAIFERHDISQDLPRVVLGSTDQAQWLANLPDLTGNGHHLTVTGRNVALTDASIGVLSELDEDDDGHFDGTNIWIGGTEYPVERAIGQVWVIVRTVADPGQERQAISRERATWPVDLSSAELSAADLGCEPGSEFTIEVVDDEDRLLVAAEVTAQ